jgi:cytochrome c2
MKPVRIAVLAAVLAAVLPLAAGAADPAQGRKLVDEKKCEICHNNKTLGDAKAVYLRKDRKVTSMEKLKSQVALCNSELNLQLFPEDEEHIVAYLNQAYYKFPAKK